MKGRIIPGRSEDFYYQRIEAIRDTVPGFTGVISDLGGPTANVALMLRCKSPRAEQTCRRLSCVYRISVRIWILTMRRRSIFIAAPVS